jgi:membrane protease YdiL (CAAX protease family)
MRLASRVEPERRHQWPVRWPVLAPLMLLGIAFMLRILDIFVLRLDEQLGEIVLSKSLGFALIVGYVWLVGQRLPAIGLSTRNLWPALAIGAGITIVAFLVAGVVQLVIMPPDSTLAIAAVDPKTGMSGGGGFAVLLLMGNVINSLMEEALFRGIMLTHFLQRMTFWRANALQAALFAAWHLVWPLKAFLSGETSALGALAQTGSLLLGTFVAGLVYGYLFWCTGSLWAPCVAHFLNNTILNLIQVRQLSGELESAVIMSIVVVVVLAFLAFAVGPIAKRLRLAHLRPWPGALSHPVERLP